MKIPTILALLSTFVLAALAQADLVVSNDIDHVIQRISPSGAVTPFASGVSAAQGLALDLDGNLLAAEPGNNSIRKITPNGTVTTFASGLNSPVGVAVDGAGYVYCGSAFDGTILQISPDGTTVTPFASDLGGNSIEGLAFDGAGNLFAAISGSGASDRVVMITDTGDVSTFATFGTAAPHGLAFGLNGMLYVSGYSDGNIYKITPGGDVNTFATGLNQPVGIAVEGTRVFVVNNGNGNVSKITADGTVSTFATGLGSATPPPFSSGAQYISAAPQVATTAIWLGGAGNWTDPARWSTNPVFPDNGMPTPTYRAIIDNGTVTLDADITIDQLMLDGATLDGASNLTLADPAVPGPSFITGPATLTGSGEIRVAAGSELTFAGNETKTLTDRVVRGGNSTSGTLTFDLAGGTVLLGGTARIEGGDLGVDSIYLIGDGTIGFNGGTPSFGVSHAFYKTGHGTTTIDVPFTLDEPAEGYVQYATLRLTRGGTVEGLLSILGDLELDGTAPFHLENTSIIQTESTGVVHLFPGSTIVAHGDPTLGAHGGLILIDDATVTSSQFSGLTISGDIGWMGTSTLNGPGEIVIQCDAFYIGEDATKTLTDCKLTIEEGDWDFAPAGGTLLVGGTAFINIQSQFNAIDDGTIGFNGGTPILSNRGVITKTGSDTTTRIDIPYLDDGGFLDVRSGTLQFSRGGEFYGEGRIRNNARLEFAGADTFNLIGAVYNDGGEVRLLPGTTVNVDYVTLENVDLVTDNATITGVGDLELSDTIWSGAGTMSGDGYTLFNVVFIFDNATKTIMDRTVDLNFLEFAPDGGTLRLGGVALLDSQDLFFAEGEGTVAFDGGTPVIENNGQFYKSGAGTRTLIDVPFTNNAYVAVESGTLEFSRGYSHFDTLEVFADGVAKFTGGGVTLAGTIQGKGTIVSDTTLTIDEYFSPGFTSDSGPPGTLTFESSLILGGSSTTYLRAGATTGSDKLVVQGDLALDGVLSISDSGDLAEGTYTLIEYTGTLSGAFASVDSPASFAGALVYDVANKRVLLTTVPVFPDLTSWQTAKFGPDAGNPAIAGPLVDPDGDGVPNLLEYALGLDPLAPGAAPTSSADEGGYPTLIYTRSKGHTDLQYIVEITTDLVGPWKSGPGFTEEVSVIDNGISETVTTRGTTPIAVLPGQFIRLRVESAF